MGALHDVTGVWSARIATPIVAVIALVGAGGVAVANRFACAGGAPGFRSGAVL